MTVKALFGLACVANIIYEFKKITYKKDNGEREVDELAQKE
jgi:hypothetical protein